MSDHVYKKLELVGSSETSIEDAVQNAISRAAKTIRNLRILSIDKEDNILAVEGAVPGHKDGYVLINKAKKPPQERRGFAGATTLDPLKAAKKAAAGKAKK